MYPTRDAWRGIGSTPSVANALPDPLPIGTRVILRKQIDDCVSPRPAGAVASIVSYDSSRNHYTLVFLDGGTAVVRRTALDVLRPSLHAAARAALVPPTNEALRRFVIFRCVVGSRAFGLDDEQSDIDVRGFYLPAADLHWSLAGIPEQIEFDETQETFWEAEKFVRLALNGNPNILECLYSPRVEYATSLAEDLIASRGRFLSKLVYQTYSGYIGSQFKKLQADLRQHGRVKWKHAMHLLRLLMSGLQLVREGTMNVSVGPNRDRLLSVKRGEVPFDEVDRWRLSLQHEFDDSFVSTPLPDSPDYRLADDWLCRARRSMINVDP